MLGYILRRILIFIPTLIAISLLAFWLSKVAPGDPVLSCNLAAESEFEITRELYQEMYEDMGLQKPLFYLSFTTAAYPDTFYRIPGRYHQEALAKLIDQYGNWPTIQHYDQALESFNRIIENLPKDTDRNTRIQLRRPSSLLFEAYEDTKISNFLKQIQTTVHSTQDTILHSLVADAAQNLSDSYAAVKSQTSPLRGFLPRISWNGFDNQYHHWITNFLQGDFGISCRGGRPVLQRIRTPIFWTIIMSVLSILLTYILAIPLGVFSAEKRSTWRDRLITTFLFVLYSLPTFWIATMLLVFFTTPEYGMDWFEGAGLGRLDSDAPFWARFWETAQHLILPVLCLTYPSLAFVSRQMRGGMLEVLNQDFIRTARAKGVAEHRVIWHHAFRNALFPLLTLFAAVFPAVVTGSVVIEVIFNIPGMGREVVDAIFAKDWPVLYSILMIVAILTMLGNLIVDILYAAVDPRVKF
jgi:peptide/nickel transport system permease protein